MAKPKGNIILSVDCSLHIFDIQTSAFVQISKSSTCSIIVSETGFESWIFIKDDTRSYVYQKIDDRMNPHFNTDMKSFIWVYFAQDGRIFSLSIILPNLDSLISIRDTIGTRLYETLNQESFNKVKKDEQTYLLNAYMDDVEMTDADNLRGETSDNEDKDESDKEEEKDDDDDDDETESSVPIRTKDEDGISNSQLAVAFKNDRSFVVRGSKIGVFKSTDDNSLQFATTINNVRSLDGQTFSPQKVMLHNQDQDLLMMKPKDDHNIYKMDLEYGKVVEQWHVDDYMTIENVVPEKKYAQLTSTQTLIGLNHNSVFRIDPRLPGSKRVDSDTKQYLTKSDFSCGTTTGSGELAVGSKKGDIRLYNKLNVRAKTHLPGLGDPIKGIDTTENGKFIIATCKNYLLLINTELRDKDGTTGFTKSMGAEKPVPKRLQIRPEHVAWMGIEINFTTAKFNTGEKEEKTIVTSSGPYVIIWDFKKVKAGILDSYFIKKYSDNIVADNFKYGHDKSIIVALPDDVTMVAKKQLQTPTKLLKSRSSIVSSPY